ncbi:neuroguidin-like isoform X3 [Polypterus senegalus]|uniref:neuroguidin-like isoform X3 n=1 Tax=Polypterus senegalus TaxID=55291 RepID=UPI001964CF45|nr:neuroguidin-like isoform X3 [Polypterus senegalus]
MATTNIDHTLVEQDLPEAVKLLTNMTEQVAAVTSHIQHLKRLVQNKVFQTAKTNCEFGRRHRKIKEYQKAALSLQHLKM